MSQEITDIMKEPLTEEQVKMGIIRPYDQVTFEYKGCPFFKDGTKEDIHPTLAQKLVNKGYGKIVANKKDTSGVSKLTTEAEAKAAAESSKKKKGEAES